MAAYGAGPADMLAAHKEGVRIGRMEMLREMREALRAAQPGTPPWWLDVIDRLEAAERARVNHENL